MPQPGADQAPAIPDEPRPTFQTAASEAADVAARAVAQQVAATAAARAAAAEAAAEREAAEAQAAAERAEAERAAAERAAAEQAAAAAASMNDAILAAEASMTAPTADASMTATDAAIPATGTIQTVPAAEAAAVAGTPVVAAAPVVPAAPATPKPSRRPVVIAWVRRLAIFTLSIVLLLGGLMLGSTTFQRTRITPVAGGAEEFTQPPADVAREFITALAAGDSDAIRSSLSEQPNKDLTDEFSKFGIKTVKGVETLGTSVDGPRSATEVLLHTVTTEGNPFDINLIILVNGNTIEGFR